MPVFLSNRKVSIVDIMFLTSFLLLHCFATSTLAMAYHNNHNKFEPSPQTNSIFPSNHHIQNSPKLSDSSVTKLPSNLQSSHLSTSSNKNKHGVKDIKVYYQSGVSLIFIYFYIYLFSLLRLILFCFSPFVFDSICPLKTKVQ